MSDGAATSGTSNLDDGNHGNGCFWGNPNFVSQDSFKHRYEYDNDFYLSNFFEYEQGNVEPLFRGRTKSNIQFWIDIGAPEEIVNVIRHGYKIPMFATPTPRHFNNNKSAVNHSEFVSEAIIDLLSKNLITECVSLPDIINPLTVSVQSSGKKRLILDLRYVNHFVWKQKVKFEDWKVV